MEQKLKLISLESINDPKNHNRDDEIKAIETLQMLLTNYCDGIEIIGTASSSDEALKLINNSEPDLIFLDIEMPKKTGFELINDLGAFHFSLICYCIINMQSKHLIYQPLIIC